MNVASAARRSGISKPTGVNIVVPFGCRPINVFGSEESGRAFTARVDGTFPLTIEEALEHWAEHGFKAELEEVEGNAERVIVCVRTPGIDEHRGRDNGDRSFAVLTVRDGRIVALRDCRDREEARAPGGARVMD